MLYNKVIGTLTSGCSRKLDNYENGSMLILKPDFFTDLRASFDYLYHFSILLGENSPPLIVDGKKYTIPQTSFIAVNPGQISECHPPAMEYYPNDHKAEYLTVFIQKDFLNRLSYEIMGKTNVMFHNMPVPMEKMLTSLMVILLEEWKRKEPGHQLMFETLSSQIAVFILRSAPNSLSKILDNNADREYRATKDIGRVIDFMHSNSTERACLEDLCGIAHLSPYYFIKVFKSHTGKTPYEYYIDIKLENAAQLLKQKEYSVTEISYMTGFSSQSYFSALFKKKVGCTPLQYRNQYK